MDFQRPENAARRVTSASMMMMMTERATGEEEASGEEEDPGVDADEKKQRRLVTPATPGGGGRRLSGGGIFCQAEKCAADLTEAKRYHRRHKVCEFHAKAPSVLVAGLRQRFCQQCSRFHELSEFDGAKRSCRRRLAGHNERRRKSTAEPQQGEPSSASTSASSMGHQKGPNGQSPQQPQCRPVDHERASRVMSYPPGNSAAYKHFHIR